MSEDDSNVYGIGPVILGLISASMNIGKIDGITDEDTLIDNKINEGKIVENDFKPINSLATLYAHLLNLYGGIEDVKVYIGTPKQVEKSLQHGIQCGVPIISSTEFAIGVKSDMKWLWDTSNFRTKLQPSGFDIWNEGSVKWEITEDKNLIAIRIPIKYKNNKTNIIFWQWKTQSPIKKPSDDEMMEFYYAAIKIEKKVEYDKISFPKIGDDVFKRPEWADGKSNLIRREFGTTGFKITQFIHEASFSMDDKGGHAKSQTMIVVARGMSLLDPPQKCLSFIRIPFGFAIEIIDSNEIAHCAYVGYSRARY